MLHSASRKTLLFKACMARTKPFSAIILKANGASPPGALSLRVNKLAFTAFVQLKYQ